MAGRSNRGRNRRGSQHSTNSSAAVVSSGDISNGNSNAPESSNADSNGVPVTDESCAVKLDTDEAQASDSAEAKLGELHLYPVPVKTQEGEKFELQLNPEDSVLDVRQFLLDAPQTCFFTCYDLLLHEKDSLERRLEDYNEISEVADITSGCCSLEMVPALYDDRSIRAHIHRARELLSLSSLHASLSTSLALQEEHTKTTTASSVDPMRTVLPEADGGLGFVDDVTGSLGNLIVPSSKEIKCVESIVFSSFNPPPSHRRLVGDLIYLDVVTLENAKFCITGTTKAFYVNSSTGNTFDSKPSKNASEATTLIGLLQKISSKFKKAFREILERKASAHPFENVHSLLPPNSWLGLHPIPDHKRDAARAESALTLSYGSEIIGMQRDWNEELQSCREFPHTTTHERILRARALYKVTSDFVDSARNGAVGVISGCIPPINPADPECFHMYVHNNIFFSIAVDADIEKLWKIHTSDTNSEDGRESSVSDSSGNNLRGAFEVPNGSVPSSLVELNGVSEKDLDISTKMQLADSEQATYASSNNDLKGTRAYQEANVPGLYNLAMAIIDYGGHRVVAQSVLPGILQGDKSDSLLYGSIDNGKKIFWNEDFHAKVLVAAKRLHLKEHAVLDGSGNAFKIAAPVECKGILGSDDRHYILDLLRVTPRDVNYTGRESRFCILRPELVTSFLQAEAAKRLNHRAKSELKIGEPSGSPDANPVNEMEGTKEDTTALASNSQDTVKEDAGNTVEECHPACAETTESCEDILFNPNVFTEFKLPGSPEEIAADEEQVKKASWYLTETVLPKFIRDLCTLEVSPMDGQTLTEALHAHGINVRYVGKVANGTKHLPHLWDLCTNEIVVRSAKHVLKGILRDTEDHDLGPAISHFLNCFFGNCVAVVKNTTNCGQDRNHNKDLSGHQAQGKYSSGQTRLRRGSSAGMNQSTYKNFSSESLWFEIAEFAKLKYQFELPENARLQVKKVAVIRNLCQKVGITIAARKYDFDAVAPFQTPDILDLQPVVKHSVPIFPDARDLVEAGKVQLAEGMLSEAYTLFLEASSMLQQVTGPMHRDVANCCRYLAMVLYHVGDMAGAIMQQHKELIINERCLGLDHPDTGHSYGNMALFYHGLNQSEIALRHMSRALLLLSLSCGPDHPDMAATFINVAMMYQDIGKMDTALRYLQEALKKNEKLLGADHIQTAVCYHALAIAFNCMGAYKLSYQHEKKTYDILVKQLGEEDARTRDSENWMRTFKMREVQANAQKQKGQSLNAASTQKAIDILKANPNLIHAFHAAAAAGGSGSSGSAPNRSLNAALIGETVPRGRGIDERAARAAAEVRKKAAARGLLIRPHGVQVQALPPITQLLNVINSGMTPDAVANEGSGGSKKVANGGDPSHDQRTTEEAPSEQGQRNETPAGLGKGFASLDPKKRKGKEKVKF